ncbi:MAG: hypothetical protein SVV03_03330, partial [Candidatus Nanohaloarchaea archaeon]|nr:hypothetical protein [Candidatus Nanohaloarchaea archaeon]
MGEAKIHQDKLDLIAEKIVDNKLAERHRERAEHLYRTIYEIEDSTPKNAQLLFNIAMQQRGAPKSDEFYQNLSSQFNAEEF